MSSDAYIEADDIVVRMRGVGKFYEIYEKPHNRLFQMICRGRKQFYREYWACRNIDLVVRRGECLGIVGRNGAGKSTILQLIAGTLTPSEGTVEVNGRIAALLELGSGFNPEFTGRENVLLNAAILGLSEREIQECYDKIVTFADIGDFIDRPIKTYSSGMVVRLAFAVMANVNADVLIIDEALAVGDAFFTQKCMRFLRDFIEHKTVIFVSHDTNAVCSLCNRAILMEKGRITLAGTPKDVSQKYLEEIYAEAQGREQVEAVRHVSEERTLELPQAAELSHEWRDMRLDLFNGSTLRNDIEVFKFEYSDKCFGTGKAVIADVRMTNEAGAPYTWIVGGEKVFLRVRIKALDRIERPIVGFLVNNRTGQPLFGDNTFITYADKPMALDNGDILDTCFEFPMPILQAGEYYVTVSIAEGTQQNHVQHEWRHEAITFVSHSTSLATGMVGVPMLSINMEKSAGI